MCLLLLTRFLYVFGQCKILTLWILYNFFYCFFGVLRFGTIGLYLYRDERISNAGMQLKG